MTGMIRAGAGPRSAACLGLLLGAVAVAGRARAADPESRGNCEEITVARDEIRSAQNSLFGVLELLSSRTGITFHTAGDPGSEDWLLIRGLPRDSSRNVLLLLDGVPLNNAYSEGWDISDVPLGAVERIEVCKPPLPAAYGGYHSAVRIETAEGSRGRAFSASAVLGNLDTQQLGLSGSTGDESVSLLGDVGLLRTNGLTGIRRTPPYEDFTFEDRSYRDASPFLKMSYRPTEGSRLAAWAQYLQSKKAYSKDEYGSRDVYRVNLAGTGRLSGRGLVTAGAYYGFEDFFLRLKMHPDISGQNRSRFGGRAQAEYPLPASNTARAGVEATRTATTSPSHTTDASFHSWGAWIEDEYMPMDLLRFTAGLRSDAARVGNADVNPSVGVEWRAFTGNRVHGRWSVSTRWPSGSELPDAGPLPRGERLTGFDLGIGQAFWGNRMSVDVSGFALRLDHQLVPSSETGAYANSPDRSVSRGVESSLDWRPLDALTLFTTYTFTDTVDEKTGEPIAYGPCPHAASTGAWWRRAGNAVRISTRYLGEKKGVFRMGGESTRVDDALVLDAQVAHALSDWVGVSITGSNLTNLRYETFQGRPMLGRMVLVGIEMNMNPTTTSLTKETDHE